MTDFHRVTPSCNFPRGRDHAKVNSYCCAPGAGVREKPGMAETGPNRLERRAAQRFEVLLPVAVHYEGRTIPAFSQNLSSRGIFIYSEGAVPEGAMVELTFRMPSEVSLGASMAVRARGRVLRVAASEGAQRTGIAVKLDSYQYLPAEEEAFIFHVLRNAGATAGEADRPAPR